MRWAEYVARMGEMRNAYNTSVGIPEYHSIDLGINRKVILKWILGE
jgi:hypothetical protein